MGSTLLTHPQSPSLSSPPPRAPADKGALLDVAAAIAQLMGNWASSCPQGAAAVWGACFPDAFLLLVGHASGK